MQKINLENYNEFESDYITDRFNETSVFYDGVKMPLMDVAKYEDCKVDELGNVYHPASFSISVDEDKVTVTDYDLLCTKEEMLQAWNKEEHPELYVKDTN